MLKLIFLINKLPADAAMDLGLKATEEALADLLVTHLAAGSSELRKQLPALLEELQNKDRLVMALAGGSGPERAAGPKRPRPRLAGRNAAGHRHARPHGATG